MDLDFPKLENGLQFDCFNYEDNPFGKFELPDFEVESFYDFNSTSLPSQINKLCIEFVDFEEISSHFALVDQNEDVVVDAKPLSTIVNSLGHYCGNITNNVGKKLSVTHQIEEYGESSGRDGRRIISRTFRRKRTSCLELDEIRKYFGVPISKAAKEMNVGVTMLKKRCRELDIMRWPHRKIKSLQSLINNVKDLGLTNEIEMLEENQRMLERLPDMELTERTKKLRQACFKANYYKKRRSLASCY